jgi:phage major head subunit gpT-like protein
VLSREPGSDRFSERFQDPAVLLASSKAIRLLMQDPREQAREVLLAASTTATPLTLRNVTGSYYLKLAQQLGAGWYRTAASTFTTDQPVETYPWLGQAPNLRKWEGERSVQELRSDVVTLINDDYEGTITFRGPDLRRDKTGQMIARAGELAQRVAQFPERLISNLILANGNAYDGAAFFADTRSVGASGNIDNNLTTGDNLAGGSAPTTAQQSNNLLIGLSRLMGFLDDQGEPLNEGAREFLAMVPASLYAATVAAVNAAFTSASATNPLSELVNSGMRFRVVLNARLGTGANDTWYLMRTDAGILPFIVQEELTMPISLDQGSEYYAMNNKAIFGHGWAGAAGYGRPELICKLKNS